MTLAIKPDAIISIPRDIAIPDSIDETKERLGLLGDALNAGGWATAAAVYAWTYDGQGNNQHSVKVPNALTMSDFATLGIRGLKSDKTVRKYRGAWAQKVDSGEVEPAAPGKTVTLPEEDFKASGVHVSNNSGEIEWYTPREYLEAARRVMGGIDLDPASSETAQKLVGASVYYTQEDDGLVRPWSGRVWMNPPYSNKNNLMADFVGRFIEFLESGDVSEGVVLANNGTETAVLQGLLERYDAICYHATRIKFLNRDLEPANTPLQGQLFFYFGPNTERFRDEFGQFGVVR